MSEKFPVVSIIMGIYNCESTLEESIESILNQTYQNYELILCDDGSSDDTWQIASGYVKKNPEKIILIRNDRNMGLNYTLNRCLSIARGKFIARMDGDDKSFPTRLEKEVEFLENNKEYAIVGANMDVFDENGIWGKHKYKEFPTKYDFLKGNPFSHPVCMVRTEAYKNVGGYTENKKLLRVEDFHLWVKMYNHGYVGANLPEVLHYYRDDRNGYSKRKFKYRINEAYVMCVAVKKLKLPMYGYLCAIRPILVGMLPYRLYNLLHKFKWRK